MNGDDGVMKMVMWCDVMWFDGVPSAVDDNSSDNDNDDDDDDDDDDDMVYDIDDVLFVGDDNRWRRWHKFRW